MASMLPFGKTDKKDWKLEFLHGLNALLVLALFLHFYDGDPGTIFALIAVFLGFGGTLKKRVVDFFTDTISPMAHILVLIALFVVILYIFAPKLYKAIRPQKQL